MQTKVFAQMQIAVEQIQEGPNTRTHMDPVGLREFAGNVKKVGVLEPVLLRKDEKGNWILIAGHRRLAAAKIAGLKEIPARFLEVDESQAAEIQTLENLHREDLPPLDEAHAFKHLLDLGRHTVESLAAQVDKSVKYVYRSIRLLDLPKEAIKALEQGILTTGHAHQILRAPEKNIESLVKYATTRMDWLKRYPTVDELKQRIERTIEKDLAAAPFPKDVAYGGEISCAGCPFNTGNQEALFDGAMKGKCTNPGCFNRKNSAFLKELQSSGAAKFAGLKFLGAGSENGYGSGPMQVKGAYVVEKVDEKIKKAMQAQPDQFGFGIVKPSRWGGKKPHVVLLCKEAKLAGLAEPKATAAYRQPTPEEREREEFVQRHVHAAYCGLIVKKLEFDKSDLMHLLEAGWGDEWKRHRLTPLLEAVGIQLTDPKASDFPSEALEKKSRESLIQLALLFLLSRDNDEITALLEGKKVKFQEFVKQAQVEALKRWAEEHPKAA
jgi:ParB/RepB/Spo0J family partition protein